MDYQYNNYEYNSKKTMNHSTKFCYLKKAIKILLYVSAFSFLFSQSIDNYSIKFFTYKTERNYIFLLCNGILVLIIQTSGLISKITPVEACTSPKARGTTPDHEADKIDGEFQEKNAKGIEKVGFLDEEKGLKVIDRDDDHSDCNNKKAEEMAIIWEDIKEIEDEEEMISADELNKKCEDFIKKVKQEIQVEFRVTLTHN